MPKLFEATHRRTLADLAKSADSPHGEDGRFTSAGGKTYHTKTTHTSYSVKPKYKGDTSGNYTSHDTDIYDPDKRDGKDGHVGRATSIDYEESGDRAMSLGGPYHMSGTYHQGHDADGKSAGLHHKSKEDVMHALTQQYEHRQSVPEKIKAGMKRIWMTKAAATAGYSSIIKTKDSSGHEHGSDGKFTSGGKTYDTKTRASSSPDAANNTTHVRTTEMHHEGKKVGSVTSTRVIDYRSGDDKTAPEHSAQMADGSRATGGNSHEEMMHAVAANDQMPKGTRAAVARVAGFFRSGAHGGRRPLVHAANMAGGGGLFHKSLGRSFSTATIRKGRMAGSYEERLGKIEPALVEACGARSYMSGPAESSDRKPYGSVIATFDDYGIVAIESETDNELGGKFFKVPYTYDDGEVHAGEPEEVEQVFQNPEDGDVVAGTEDDEGEHDSDFA